MTVHVDWADFRIPPVNLWVMPEWNPGWRGITGGPSQHRPPLNASLLRRRFLQLLTTRGREG